MNKQPELTLQTRQNLVDAYFRLRAQGQKGTVRAVTELAGYNRCTFYRYYADTEQLLREVEGEICAAFFQALPRDFSVGVKEESLTALADVYEQYGKYISVLLGHWGDPQFVVQMKNIIRPVASAFFTATSLSAVVAELKIEFAMSAMLAVVTKWFDMGRPIPLSQLGEVITQLLCEGIFPSLDTTAF